jgi:hypothetical protein
MKWLIVAYAMLFSLPALAVNSPALAPGTKQAPAETQIVNGKRFFSLQNVRRFNGSNNSPKALSVTHAPRQKLAPTVQRGTGAPASAATAAGAKMPPEASDQVLSVFAPDDKRIPAVPAR